MSISEAKILFLMFLLAAMVNLKQQHAHVLKLSKLINLSDRYQNSSDMKFLQAGRSYFNYDFLSCAMVLLIIFLSETRINFIYVDVTYVYVTQFTFLSKRNSNVGILNVIKITYHQR